MGRKPNICKDSNSLQTLKWAEPSDWNITVDMRIIGMHEAIASEIPMNALDTVDPRAVAEVISVVAEVAKLVTTGAILVSAAFSWSMPEENPLPRSGATAAAARPPMANASRPTPARAIPVSYTHLICVFCIATLESLVSISDWPILRSGMMVR